LKLRPFAKGRNFKDCPYDSMKENRYKKGKRKSFKLILFGGLFFCLLGGAIYFAVWSDFFWIEEVEFADSPSGTEKISLIVQENLEEKIWRVIPQKSIVLIPVNKIRNNILNSFPEIKEVVIQKKLPNILEIKIEKREMIGIWCQIKELEQKKEETATSTEDVIIKNKERKIDKCFHIDKEGVIFKESPLIRGSLILNIYGFKNEPVELRDNITSPEIMDFILSVRNGLPLKSNNFEIVSIEDLRVTSSNNWQIYFNPSYSADSQLNALKMILEEEIKENINSLEYIDLRIENRVYYK